MKRFDVLIIGGGPAGSACARRLKQGGASCLILDRQPFPRPKPCAGWITPRVVNDLDLELPEYPHGLTTFPSLRISLRGIPLVLPGRQHAVRRHEFDEWLLRRTAVPFTVHRVRNIEQTVDGYRVDGAFHGTWLVGAGGTHCPVHRSLFRPFGSRDEGARIVAMAAEVPYKWKDGRCRLWFFDNGLPGYGWYVPKTGGYVNVGVGGAVAKLRARGESITTHWHRLAGKLEKSGLVRGRRLRPRSHVYHLQRNAPVVRRGNAFLVGDAAGLATVDLGEGIGPAIRSGILAAEAILDNGDYSVRSIARFSFPVLSWFGRLF
jgi:flavin-dependent dehydrogenase